MADSGGPPRPIRTSTGRQAASVLVSLPPGDGLNAVAERRSSYSRRLAARYRCLLERHRELPQKLLSVLLPRLICPFNPLPWPT